MSVFVPGMIFFNGFNMYCFHLLLAAIEGLEPSSFGPCFPIVLPLAIAILNYPAGIYPIKNPLSAPGQEQAKGVLVKRS